MASSKKDMRRADLIVPYVEFDSDQSDANMSSTIASTMPMAAIFTRNKMIGWVAVVFAVQSWLGETREQKKKASTPSYFSVLMAFMSLAVVSPPLLVAFYALCPLNPFKGYLPLFMPPGPQQAGTGTEVLAPRPSS